MPEIISRSVEETGALGRRWGMELAAGWLIGLTGDLGAGKTQLVKGIASGLGAPNRVHSPTFSLMHEYQGGRVKLLHLDLYRLRSPEEIISAGLDACFDDLSALVAVEWVERWLGGGLKLLSPRISFRRVNMISEEESVRRIQYEDTRP